MVDIVDIDNHSRHYGWILETLNNTMDIRDTKDTKTLWTFCKFNQQLFGP